PAILKIGRSDPNNISFDQDGNIIFNNNQTVDGMQPSQHIADEDAHHPKSHSHDGVDGSGQIDLANFDTLNQLPLEKVQDAQSATEFNDHDHDGINSQKVLFNNLDFTGAINPFDAEEHHHSSDLDGGEIDLANFYTANQLPLSKVEGWNA